MVGGVGGGEKKWGLKSSYGAFFRGIEEGVAVK